MHSLEGFHGTGTRSLDWDPLGHAGLRPLIPTLPTEGQQQAKLLAKLGAKQHLCLPQLCCCRRFQGKFNCNFEGFFFLFFLFLKQEQKLQGGDFWMLCLQCRLPRPVLLLLCCSQAGLHSQLGCLGLGREP